MSACGFKYDPFVNPSRAAALAGCDRDIQLAVLEPTADVDVRSDAAQQLAEEELSVRLDRDRDSGVSVDEAGAEEVIVDVPLPRGRSQAVAILL
jgi:hypothetical protein